MPALASEDDLGGVIETYSPLVANQPAAHAGGHRKKTWNIVVNSSEVQDIEYSNVLNGEPMPWKLAMWGSAVDSKVLQTLARNFRTVGDLGAYSSIRSVK